MLRKSCIGLMCSCQGLARMARDAYCGLNVSEAERAAGVLELRLVARGLSLGMRCTSVSLRNKWTTLLGKLLRRIAASTHCVLHRWDAAPGGAALGAAERAERDRDMTCAAPPLPAPCGTSSAAASQAGAQILQPGLHICGNVNSQNHGGPPLILTIVCLLDRKSSHVGRVWAGPGGHFRVSKMSLKASLALLQRCNQWRHGPGGSPGCCWAACTRAHPSSASSWPCCCWRPC